MRGTDAAGRAIVAGRGLSRSVRHRAHPWHRTPAKTMAALALRDRTRGRHHRFRRPFGQQIPGQAGQRAGQAARLCGDRHGGSQKSFCATRRSGSCAAPARYCRQGWSATASPPSANCRMPIPGELAQPLWRDRAVAGTGWPMPRIQPRGGSWRRDEDHLLRDHFQQGSVRLRRTGKHAVAAGRAGVAPAPRPRAWPARPSY